MTPDEEKQVLDHVKITGAVLPQLDGRVEQVEGGLRAVGAQVGRLDLRMINLEGNVSKIKDESAEQTRILQDWEKVHKNGTAPAPVVPATPNPPDTGDNGAAAEVKRVRRLGKIVAAAIDVGWPLVRPMLPYIVTIVTIFGGMLGIKQCDRPVTLEALKMAATATAVADMGPKAPAKK
jgi:hypothetical protein